MAALDADTVAALQAEGVNKYTYQNVPCSLYRMDLDGSTTKIGDLPEADYYSIKYENREINCCSWEDSAYSALDLFTLELKHENRALEELAFELPEPDTDIGVGINLLYNEENDILFQSYLGLFAYYWSIPQTIDIGKALDCGDQWTMQGDHDLVEIEISEDGRDILMSYPHGVDQSPTNYCRINLRTGTYEKLSEAPDDFVAGAPLAFDAQSYGESGSFSSLWILRNGVRWYPFQAE